MNDAEAAAAHPCLCCGTAVAVPDERCPPCSRLPWSARIMAVQDLLAGDLTEHGEVLGVDLQGWRKSWPVVVLYRGAGDASILYARGTRITVLVPTIRYPPGTL